MVIGANAAECRIGLAVLDAVPPLLPKKKTRCYEDQTPSSPITQTLRLKFRHLSKLQHNNKEQSFKYKHSEISNNGK